MHQFDSLVFTASGKIQIDKAADVKEGVSAKGKSQRLIDQHLPGCFFMCLRLLEVQDRATHCQKGSFLCLDQSSSVVCWCT